MKTPPVAGVDQNTLHLSVQQARVCWTQEVSQRRGEANTSTGWCAASRDQLESYEAMRQAGVELFGPGSHWIERRTVPWDCEPSADLLQGG